MNDRPESRSRSEAAPRRPWKSRLTACLGGASLCLTQLCYAAHWQSVGPTNTGLSGEVYMDMDSVREDQGYRVALFLTIYLGAVPNSHGIKLDRITQETAFDCKRREATLLETVGYFEGRKIGGSSAREGDWKERFAVIPQDPFSQRALDLACNAPLAFQPEAPPLPADAPGSVRLAGPDGVVKGGATSSADK